jgi:hypothetical protein
MLRLKDLDVIIARLDRAVVRSLDRPDDPLAGCELAYCLGVFARCPISPVLPPNVVELILQTVALSRKLTSSQPDGLARFRDDLFDIAAAIGIQPWEQWVAAPVGDGKVVCPLWD